MDKYQKLWEYIASQNKDEFDLTYDQIAEIAGVPIDHSFLNYKKNLLPLGFEVKHISMKNKVVSFRRA